MRYLRQLLDCAGARTGLRRVSAPLVVSLLWLPCLPTSGEAASEAARAIPIRVGADGSHLDPVDALATPAPRLSEEEQMARLSRAHETARRGAGDLGPSSPGSHVPRYGGDDVLVFTHSEIPPWFCYSMDIAENGDIYVAIEALNTDHYSVYIYRSTDGGDTWSQWGIKNINANGFDYRQPAIHVAEGVQNRLYLTYQYRAGVGAARQIWVSYASLAGASAVWTDRLVMNEAGVDYANPDVSSDEMVNANFVLFVTASGSGADGDDIWFTRSADQGGTYAPEYRIRSESASTFDARLPRVVYGHGGILHVAWSRFRRSDNEGRAETRRAVNWAAGGEPDFADTTWQFSVGTGETGHNAHPAASHDDDNVLLGFIHINASSTLIPANVWRSANQGYTWTDLTLLPLAPGDLDLLAIPGSRGYRAQLDAPSLGYGIQGSTSADPLGFDEFHQFSDAAYFDGLTGGRLDMDYDATRSYRLGFVWKSFHGSGPDSVFFDAEWRSDPGYPNLEPGFPLALPVAPVSPPGICELDGDVQSEIVYGDAAGNIQVLNHDGSPVPGWPKDIGAIPADSPVAVGDLDGDGQYEVVCGNTIGFVHAFRNDGTPLAGWPVDMGSGAATYVSIGKVNASSNRQVVVTSGTQLGLLSAGGVMQPGFPTTMATPIHAPAAIGDVDADGSTEIVLLQESYCNVIGPTGINEYFRLFGGDVFRNAPTLADLDKNGDLEIVAPTDDGRVFVLEATVGLPDHAGGWPLDVGSGSPITSVALANVVGTLTIDLAFAEENNSTVHLYTETKAIPSGWPHATAAGLPGAPIMDTFDTGSPDIAIGSLGLFGYAWNNIFTEVPGWPRALDDNCRLSPASGDIDNDGKVEVVFLTDASMLAFDLGANIDRADPFGQWPMYAYNPQRTGCLNCGPDVVTAVELGPAMGVRFDAPFPNPGAAMTFRFDLPNPASARLLLYDAAGRLVRRLLKRELATGRHEVAWDGRADNGVSLAPGIYYARLEGSSMGASFHAVRKVTLMH